MRNAEIVSLHLQPVKRITQTFLVCEYIIQNQQLKDTKVTASWYGS